MLSGGKTQEPIADSPLHSHSIRTIDHVLALRELNAINSVMLTNGDDAASKRDSALEKITAEGPQCSLKPLS